MRKEVVSRILFLFIIVSVGYLIFKETSAPEVAPVGIATLNDSEESVALKRKIIVNYFHGNARCTTCKTIEAYTKEAISKNFASEVKAGIVEMRAINVEVKSNEHFVEDFQLTTRSVVLECVVNGKRENWNNLSRVWELIRGEKEDYLNYIKTETAIFLEDKNK